MLSANDSDKRFDVANARAPMLSEALKDVKQKVQGLVLRTTDKFAEASLIIGKTLRPRPEQKIFRTAGLALQAIRNLGRVTQNEISDAYPSMDIVPMKTIEDGWASPSYKLILRIAALSSRHDAPPFIIKYFRRLPCDWKTA